MSLPGVSIFTLLLLFSAFLFGVGFVGVTGDSFFLPNKYNIFRRKVICNPLTTG